MLRASLAFVAASTNGNASWVQLRDGERSQLLSSPTSAESANSCVILSSSRNADSISSDRTTNLLPLSRCASTIQSVRPFGIHGRDPAQTPTGFAELICNGLPVPNWHEAENAREREYLLVEKSFSR